MSYRWMRNRGEVPVPLPAGSHSHSRNSHWLSDDRGAVVMEWGSGMTAVALARNHGLFLFPAKKDKTPATPHGFKDASNDPDTVAQLFEEYRGQRIGLWPGPSGLVVVDIDVKLGGSGEEEWYDLAKGQWEYGPQATTPSGGRHLYFRKPPGLVFDNTSLDESIDIRSDNGYVIWPTPDSGYEWDLGYEGEWCEECPQTHPKL